MSINLDQFLTDPNLFQVTATYNNELIGVRVFKYLEDKVHLTYTVVKIPYRNMGINKLMLKEIERIVTLKGINLLTSNVRISNIPSKKSLEHSGFIYDPTKDGEYSDGEKKLGFYKVL